MTEHDGKETGFHLEELIPRSPIRPVRIDESHEAGELLSPDDRREDDGRKGLLFLHEEGVKGTEFLLPLKDHRLSFKEIIHPAPQQLID